LYFVLACAYAYVASENQAQKPISTQEIFPQNENFVKSVIARQKFSSGKKFEAVNFQLLTMIF
jgi:hypothetical protein